MRKSILSGGVIIAVVLTLLTAVPALAAKPTAFNASGTISAISPGTVFPAGESDRWRVVERDITGTLSGDINGDFTMTYRANIESVETQAGNFHGTLDVDTYRFRVNGTSEPLEFIAWFAPGIPLYKSVIYGRWTFLEGANGTGDFNAYSIFIPTPDGHVAYIVNSAFIMTGQWQP
jgi:hypothetical protein